MPFDLQSLLSLIGMGGDPQSGTQLPLGAMQGLGGFMTGAGQGGMMPASAQGINTGPAQMPTPSPAPSQGGLASLLGMSPGGLGGFGSPGGIGGSGLGGPMSLINAGANMLTASGPRNAGLGSILGSGLGGLMAGGQADRATALQQQQQAALQRIAEQLMRAPSGAQPTASATTPVSPNPLTGPGGSLPSITPGGGVQGGPPTPGGGAYAGSPQGGPGGVSMPPSVPGAPPAPGISPASGSNPFTAPQGGPGGNPFIQMMLQRRFGRMA